MVEYTTRQGAQVQITRRVSAGDNIVPTGSEAKRGERLFSPGLRLDYAAVAVAASVGRSRVLVYRKPQVAILATGDEIVDIDVPPGANQIRNSNSYSLAAQVQAAGGEPVLLPIAPDQPGRLRELIADGLEADLLLLAGGVSMGKYDLVEQVLEEFQAEFFFTGVLIQPGNRWFLGEYRTAGDDCAAKRQRRHPSELFLRPSGKPAFHDGDFRTLCPPGDRSPRGRHASQACVPERATEI